MNHTCDICGGKDGVLELIKTYSVKLEEYEHEYKCANCLTKESWKTRGKGKKH